MLAIYKRIAFLLYIDDRICLMSFFLVVIGIYFCTKFARRYTNFEYTLSSSVYLCTFGTDFNHEIDGRGK